MSIPYTFQLSRIPRGSKGTEATLRSMEALVERGARDPEVILYAQQVVRNSPEHGKMAEVEAVLADARRSMRYTADPAGIETVKDPSYILREIRRHGRAVMDCDDVSVWTAALLRSVGLPTRFKVIKDDPGEFTHVYLEVLVDGRWVPLDPIARRMGVGQEPRGLFGSAVFLNGSLSGIRRKTMYKGLGASGTVAPSTPTGWDAIAAAIASPLKEAGSAGVDYLKSMYLPKTTISVAPATQRLPAITPRRPGFFEKFDPNSETGISTDWMKVGGTAAVVGLTAFLFMKRR